jgi:hypothetical protein
MIGAVLGKKAAERGGSDDVPLKGGEFLGGADAREENSGAVKEVDSIDADWDRRPLQLTEACMEALVLIVTCTAQELQGDMPGFGWRPAQLIVFGTQTGDDSFKLSNERICQRKSDEETHESKTRFKCSLIFVTYWFLRDARMPS